MTGSSDNKAFPLVEELETLPDVFQTMLQFHDQPYLLLLESRRNDLELGRYSFLTADPFEVHQLDRALYGVDPFKELKESLSKFPAEPLSGLPPFQGGAAGLLSYELGAAWEQLPVAPHDEFQIPHMAVGLYDWVIVWDHQAEKAWVISQGFPETEPDSRRARAQQRLAEIKERLTKVPMSLSPSTSSSEQVSGILPAEPVDLKAAHRKLENSDYLWSNFSREEYLKAVEQVLEYIRAGDLFQANLTQRLLSPQKFGSLQLYAQLREKNPSPFGGYFQVEDWFIASSSPERFIKLEGNMVVTRPIKGTRQRRPEGEADLFTRDELRESEKDRAENVMIVDLLRNDLSRVCKPGSIRVPELCRVETYETVQHLVSEVQGELQSDRTVWDLIAATFPGGSITGAPKIRAMEIITELESTARGPYCGSLFYVGFDGTFDSSILIRTITGRHGWLQLPVGGGVVIQSNPQDEYEETLHKASGMIRAL